jgi:carbon storage regulator
MLYLTRKIGESIIINNNIELTVVEVRGKTVKLGFIFPKEASILRKELYDKIMEQNLAAASTGQEELLNIDLDLGVVPAKPVTKQEGQPVPEKGKEDGK